MRIVIAGRYPLEEDLLCSGVERVASLLAESISFGKDLETFVVTCSNRINREEIFQRGNIKIFALPLLGRFGNIRLYKKERVSISEKIKSLTPDIIHTHDLGFYTLAGFSTGYPQVVSVHGVRYIDINFENGFLNRLRKFSISYLEEECLKYARWVIINTPYLEKKIQERSRARLFFLENPVEDEFFGVKSNINGRNLLFVGRITPIKGLFILIKALLRLKEDFPDIRVRVAGIVEDHNYFGKIKDFIQEKGLNENVIFLGCLGKEQLLEEYSKASIFVLPSFQEASPMAICEAMAAGTCIVASDVGGIPSLIRNNREGILVPPGDVEFLYTTISDLLKDDRYRIRLAESARIQAQSRFLKRKLGQTLFQIYRTILGESRPFGKSDYHKIRGTNYK